MKNEELKKWDRLRMVWIMLCAAFFILHSAFFISCTSIDCPVQNLVYTNYALKKADGSTDTLNIDTLWIKTKRADGTDTLLLNALCGSTATKFSLPISYTQPEDVFITQLTDTSGIPDIDTIRIKKENYPHFESVDCQAAYFHEITSVATTQNIIDSIVINNPHVNYDATTAHFNLYLKANR